MVKVKWWGHATFEIKGKNITVITDPHGGSVGLPEPKTLGDVVLVSHDHFDHNSKVDQVSKSGAERFLWAEGTKTVKGVTVKGIPTFHDESRGKQRGKNIVYTFNVDGVNFCHLGDLGHVPSDSQVKEIGQVDVLFIPVGGVFTVDAKGATEVANLIKPKIIIPMHYKVPGLQLGISEVKEFTRGKPRVKEIKASEVEISKDSLPKETEIWVLKI
ncbi:MAG: MBL fold metallo-hydrolase [Candidatus Jordarchaeaceae archaeon]